jgi:hypothetical protein
MAKKNFPDKDLPDLDGDFSAPPSGFSQKMAGLSSKTFGLIKFILGVCLLPFIYSITIAFLDQFALIDKSLQNSLWSGIITLLIVYLFVWEPVYIFQKGQKLLEIIFNFFRPLVRVAPFLLPIFTILLFILYGILSLFVTSDSLIQDFMFLFGFTFSLHLIFSAKSIRTKKSDFLKANYIFGFSLIYIINISLLAFCLNLIFKDFSFVVFSNKTYQIASDIFYGVFKQLFLR